MFFSSQFCNNPCGWTVWFFVIPAGTIFPLLISATPTKAYITRNTLYKSLRHLDETCNKNNYASHKHLGNAYKSLHTVDESMCKTYNNWLKHVRAYIKPTNTYTTPTQTYEECTEAYTSVQINQRDQCDTLQTSRKLHTEMSRVGNMSEFARKIDMNQLELTIELIVLEGLGRLDRLKQQFCPGSVAKLGRVAELWSNKNEYL